MIFTRSIGWFLHGRKIDLDIGNVWKTTKFNVTPEIARFRVKIEKLRYIVEFV